MEVKQIKNDFVIVIFYPKTEYHKPYIIARDLEDRHNDPTIFTKKVRGIDLAWKFLEQIFSKEELKDDIKINDIQKILDEKFNLNTHSYCAVD